MDVRHEVDVVVTHGHIPVFISCKNTRLENEHLYEIATMTRHYGGRYARAAIVSNVENLPDPGVVHSRNNPDAVVK